MKKITFFIGIIFLCAMSAYTQDVLFEEYFSGVTETWYGSYNQNTNKDIDIVLPAVDYDLYFDNAGWTGENVYLGAPTDPDQQNKISYNEVNKPRVGTWKGATDNLTTPTIDCSSSTKVSLKFKLKAVSRSAAGSTWDDLRTNVLHAEDGVNFQLLETVALSKNTADDQLSFTDYTLTISNATANSKFRFQVFQNTNTNRFFIGEVVVQEDLGTNVDNTSAKSNIVFSTNLIRINESASFSQITIFDTLGSVVYHGNKNIIDISNFSMGIYILKANMINGEKEVVKFVKK